MLSHLPIFITPNTLSQSHTSTLFFSAVLFLSLFRCFSMDIDSPHLSYYFQSSASLLHLERDREERERGLSLSHTHTKHTHSLSFFSVSTLCLFLKPFLILSSSLTQTSKYEEVTIIGSTILHVVNMLLF